MKKTKTKKNKESKVTIHSGSGKGRKQCVCGIYVGKNTKKCPICSYEFPTVVATVTCLLNTTLNQNRQIDKIFKILTKAKNEQIKYQIKDVNIYNEINRKTRKYVSRKNIKENKNRLYEKNRGVKPSQSREKYQQIRNTKHKVYSKHVGAQTYNCMVDDVIKTVEDCEIYNPWIKDKKTQKLKRKRVRFHSYRNPLLSLCPATSPKTCFKIKDGKLIFKLYGIDEQVEVLPHKNNTFFSNQIELNSVDKNNWIDINSIGSIKLIRKNINNQCRYYLQFGLKKFDFKRTDECWNGKGTLGIDINIKTIDVIKYETGEYFSFPYYDEKEFEKSQEKIHKLEIKDDYLKRLHNPDKINKDGTFKKGVRFLYTKRNRRIHNQISLLKRNQTIRKHNEVGRLINKICKLGNVCNFQKLETKDCQQSKNVNLRKDTQNNCLYYVQTLIQRRFGKNCNLIDKYEATTQTCNMCGNKVKIEDNKMYECPTCQYKQNRQVTAAINNCCANEGGIDIQKSANLAKKVLDKYGIVEYNTIKEDSNLLFPKGNEGLDS